MVKRLTKIGNSRGLIIDRAWLALFKLDETDMVELEPTSDGLGFEVRPASHRDRVRAATRQAMQDHEKALRALSE